MNRPNNGENKEKDKKNWQWVSGLKDDSLSFRSLESKRIVLSRNMMFKINLSIAFYKQETTGYIIPVTSYLSKEGTFGGYDWIAKNLSINITADGKSIEYDVSGEVVVSILNVPIYFSHKSYKGAISIE